MPTPAEAHSIPLRRAEAADHDQVMALLRALMDELDPARSPEGVAIRGGLENDIRQIWGSPASCVVLAGRPGEAPVALGRADILSHDPLFRIRPPRICGYVDQMFVTRPHRGRGLGRRILAALEKWLRGAGTRHVLLHAAPGREAFYEACAYRPNRQMIKLLGP